MRDHPDDRAVTYARAAEILGVAPGTVRWMVSTGILHKHENGRGIGAVREADVLALERERRHAARPA